MAKVENLKKITLQLEAGTTPEEMGLLLPSAEFKFIFGLGPTGMSPFEYQLVDKAEGQMVLIQLKREEIQRIFEHLHPPIMNLFEEHDALYLRVKIFKIEQPDNMEVVKAMAEMAGHHEGFGCGCG
jgi:hypothetical protein